MSELIKCLEALANWSNLQEAGVIRSYLVEWDASTYPSKFKAPILHIFDGKGSPSYIFYFKSQTRNVRSNDAIMAHLFIGTLKRIAFEWFMKLSAGFIKTLANLMKLFLARFFKDDADISVPTLLTTKQKKGESIKLFVERSRSMALWYSSGMTQSTLIETYCHNLQTTLLAQIGVVILYLTIVVAIRRASEGDCHQG